MSSFTYEDFNNLFLEDGGVVNSTPTLQDVIPGLVGAINSGFSSKELNRRRSAVSDRNLRSAKIRSKDDFGSVGGLPVIKPSIPITQSPPGISVDRPPPIVMPISRPTQGPNIMEPTTPQGYFDNEGPDNPGVYTGPIQQIVEDPGVYTGPIQGTDPTAEIGGDEGNTFGIGLGDPGSGGMGDDPNSMGTMSDTLGEGFGETIGNNLGSGVFGRGVLGMLGTAPVALGTSGLTAGQLTTGVLGTGLLSALNPIGLGLGLSNALVAAHSANTAVSNATDPQAGLTPLGQITAAQGAFNQSPQNVVSGVLSMLGLGQGAQGAANNNVALSGALSNLGLTSPALESLAAMNPAPTSSMGPGAAGSSSGGNVGSGGMGPGSPGIGGLGGSTGATGQGEGGDGPGAK